MLIVKHETLLSAYRGQSNAQGGLTQGTLRVGISAVSREVSQEAVSNKVAAGDIEKYNTLGNTEGDTEGDLAQEQGYQILEVARELFRHHDKDRNGEISLPEIDACLRSLGSLFVGDEEEDTASRKWRQLSASFSRILNPSLTLTLTRTRTLNLT